MDVLGIVYPQYWLHLDSNASFAKHHEGIKVTFYSQKSQSWVNGWERKVFELLMQMTLITSKACSNS
jgi:hypothetical protein